MHFKEMWALYYKRIIGVAAGLVFGIIYLICGFWDMCFVALLVAAGYYLGKNKEELQYRYSISTVFSTIIDYVRKLFRPYR
jgi:uncharacterized membrane protein